jgi:hypothetical protein
VSAESRHEAEVKPYRVQRALVCREHHQRLGRAADFRRNFRSPARRMLTGGRLFCSAVDLAFCDVSRGPDSVTAPSCAASYITMRAKPARN